MSKTLQQELSEFQATLEQLRAQYDADGTVTSDDYARLDALAGRVTKMQQASTAVLQGDGSTDGEMENPQDLLPDVKMKAAPEWKDLPYDSGIKPQVKELANKMLKLMDTELKTPTVAAKLEAVKEKAKRDPKASKDPYYVLQQEYFFILDTWYMVRDRELASVDRDIRVMVDLRVSGEIDAWNRKERYEIKKQIDREAGILPLEEQFFEASREIAELERQMKELIDRFTQEVAYPTFDFEKGAATKRNIDKLSEDLGAARRKLNDIIARSKPEPRETNTLGRLREIGQELRGVWEDLKPVRKAVNWYLDWVYRQNEKAGKPKSPAKP